MLEITTISEQKIYDNKVFPLTLSSNSNPQIDLNNIIEWLISNRDHIDNLLRDHKAILFRNHDIIKTHLDFHRFIEALNYQSMEYIGGAAVRTQLTSLVFTANESPSSELIPFHHEMAQTPSPPTHLFFYCEIAPQLGGETPILISTELYSRMFLLHPDFMLKLEKYGVQYVRYMPENDDPTSAIGRGWKSTFLANDKETAEKALQLLGSSWEWQADNSLKTITAVVPAIRTDNQPYDATRTNCKTFFNSVVAAYTGWNDSRNDGKKAVYLGIPCNEIEQGISPLLDSTAMEDAIMIMNEISISYKWQVGDILLLDNRTVMHSRNPFEGSRRILASLARDPYR